MRRLTLLVAVALVSFAVPARGAETWICWSGAAVDGTDRPQTVTTCLVEGSTEVRTYAAGDTPPVRLSPAVGEDPAGACWYRTTRETPWVLIGVLADGTAVLGYDPDGKPGGPVALEAAYPACTAEPAELPPPIAEAWRLLASYGHPDPAPTLDPPAGRGIVGMPVLVGVEPPEPWSAALVSPVTGRRIEVETRVDAVAVDWGDGRSSFVPRIAIPLLTGAPDGAEPHVYRTKTCARPGGDRCHPELDAYPIAVAYHWWARYRVDGGPWHLVQVPDTTTTIRYPVGEIVGVITGVG